MLHGAPAARVHGDGRRIQLLDRQIELVAPQIILTVGGPATHNLLNMTDGIMKVRGKWRELMSGAAAIRVMPTLHPAYLLRTPAAKRLVWRDLRLIKAALATSAG